MFCFLLASSAGYAAGQGAPEGNATEGIVPREDKHVRLLIYVAVDHGPRAKGAPEAIETLLTMDREKLLSALAYQMSTKDYRVCAVIFVGKYLPEKRLVPFLVRVLQEAEGDTLMEAVKAAQAIPDPRVLAPIFDRALESDYQELIYLPAPIGREVIRKPLFGEAAKAIHVITGGAVGIKDVPYEEKLRSIKQEKLPQWRQWWQENKANWPAAPPLPEKPKEPASPGKKAPEKGASEETQPPPKAEPPTDSKPAPAGAAPVPPGATNAPPAIPMRESGELNSVWTEAAARMSDDSKEWKEIQKLLRATTGSTPATKVDEFRCLYDFVRGAEEKRGQLAGAQALMAQGGPVVVRECLLHPNPDIIGAACDELVKSKPKKTDKGSVAGGQPKEKDSQAVPFLVYVLQRNNFGQQGSEEATVHSIIKRNLVDALLYITDTENQTAPVDVDEEKDVDRVLALARKWAAEKGLQPLEKERPPKAFPPTEPKPAAARQ